MDKELLDRVTEMFDEHYSDGVWTGVSFSVIVTWVIVFIILLISGING